MTRYIAVERGALRSLLNEDGPLSDMLLSTFISRREALQSVQGIGLEIVGPRGSEPTMRMLEFARANRLPPLLRYLTLSRQTGGMTLTPLDEALDHGRGPAGGGVILEYGDYECPYSRQAFRQIERVERRLEGAIRFAFRHFPLTEIHPHAFAASAAAEAAARQNRFWEMHELLFHRQKALEEDDLRRYAAELGLDAERFDRDRGDPDVAARIQRDIDSGIASGDVLGTPTLFIDGVVYRGGYDMATLIDALGS